jgi:hypothetical protein
MHRSAVGSTAQTGRLRHAGVGAASVRATPASGRCAIAYVDALRSVVAASTAVGYGTTQPPRLKVLAATSKGQRTRVQAAAIGSTAAIKRFVVRLDGKRAAQLAARTSPFTVTVRRRGKRVGIQALDASGRVLARAARNVRALSSGKSGAGTGNGVKT